MSKVLMRETRKLSFGEEVGNSISHGVMGIVCLFLLPYTAIYSYINKGIATSIGTSIYMICMFMMFMGSCIYHTMKHGSTHKYVFRKLDHCFIYLAIAGTYTPILIYLIGGKLGITLLVVQWLATIAGILITSISKYHHKHLSMILYMTMGWIAILILPKLLEVGSAWFLGLIVLGGIFYTVGAYFFAKKFPYAHFVWHIFIVLSSISHFIAVVYLM